MAKTVSLKKARAKYSISLNKTDLTQGPLILEHEGKLATAVVTPIAKDCPRADTVTPTLDIHVFWLIVA